MGDAPDKRAAWVAYLRGHGVHTAARDWALGETILVTPMPADADATLHPAGPLRYLVPEGDRWGAWAVATETRRPPARYSMLGAAARAALRRLEDAAATEDR